MPIITIIELKDHILKIFSPESVLVATILSIISYLLGGLDMSISTLCLMTCLDYATGILAAIILKQLNSQKGFKGLIKKSVMLIIIIVAVSTDRIMNTGEMFRHYTILLLFINEAISILENVSRINSNVVPKQLISVLEQLKNTSFPDKK